MTRESRAQSESTRRRVLAGLGAAVPVSIAGCSEFVGRATEADPTFEHPDTVRIDEDFSLVIDDLPDAAVEVTASAVDGNDVPWSASATYEPTDGTLDLDEDAPIDGDYDEAETMRLIQHMRPAEETDDGYAPVSEETLEIEVAVDDDAVGSTSITRTFGDPDVTGTELERPDFRGAVFEPPGTDPAPGVVVLHGSGGNALIAWAHLLASNGFVAVALQYFGATGQSQNLVEIPIERVDTAATWLAAHDRVEGSQVGVIGTSAGGELALLAGSQFDSIGPVVSVNGSGVVWEAGPGTDRYSGSSWTHDGEPVPYVPFHDDANIWDSEVPLESEPGYTTSLEEASATAIDDATIPVEEIDGPVLLVSGGDDRVWNSVELAEIAIDRLEEHDHDEYEHLIFEEAGHAILPPYRPTANREVSNQNTMGGSVAGYAEADAVYWPRALETLRQV